jgi:methylmalonyl-CoA/ethylmalonyl-CoA epimerase
LLSLDHVGVLAADLQEASAAFEALLGIPPERVSIPEVGLEARVFPVGGAAVELLHFDGPVGGIDPRVFGTRPGVQHLAFRVEDLEAAHRRLVAGGVEVLEGFPRQGVHGRILFLVEPVSGVLLELVEVDGAGGGC